MITRTAVRLASYEDFHGRIYTDYRHHEGYAKRAKLFEHFPDPILIVGCGFGFLVDELLKLSKGAYGIDASLYATLNRVNDRVSLKSILDPVDVESLRTRFATVITEDLLPHLKDEEAKIAAMNCSKLGGIVVHMVTEQGEADLTYHSTGYWMTLTNQLTVSLEGM